MSSTTERGSERGQVLVLFAGGLAVLFIIAALAFDVGMVLLERRDQQNAADAAALAGARYVNGAPSYHGTCAGGGGNPAVAAACEVALANDYDHNSPTADEDVLVDIPPVTGQFVGFPAFVQVRIEAQRAAIFAGVIGQTEWAVGANAVAANEPGMTYGFAMLSLNPDACKAIHISGTGEVNAAGNVQANSTGEGCAPGDPYGLSRTGGGVLNVTAPDATCRTAGEVQDQGSGTMTCTPAEYSFAIPDPLRDLPAPPKLPAADTPALIPVGHTSPVPDWCPGTTSATKPFSEVKDKACEVDKAWIFSPGFYPGGISVKGPNAVAFLLPGIYWIGGGGFSTTNNGTAISVATGSTATSLAPCLSHLPSCLPDGGVLIYNSKTPTSTADPISLGGGSGVLRLLPYDYPFGDTTIDLVIFQDRSLTETVTLNGGNADADLRGIVYVPSGAVKVNGSSSEFNMDQVIADTFLIDGHGGTVNVLRETGVDAIISGIGLVE